MLRDYIAYQCSFTLKRTGSKINYTYLILYYENYTCRMSSAYKQSKDLFTRNQI